MTLQTTYLLTNKNKMKLEDLNPLQINYLETAAMLKACGYPEDLFDDLFRELAKAKREKNKTIKNKKNV